MQTGVLAYDRTHVRLGQWDWERVFGKKGEGLEDRNVRRNIGVLG